MALQLQLHNKFGQLDLSVIDPKAVSELSDDAQKILSVLISAVQNREAAQLRFNSAVIGVREATAEQIAATAAHIAANPPQTAQQAQQAAIAAYNASH
ncbi:hypothetical protein SAMN05443247_03119 [Bradyrhizobium erythrophlei]|nr:hypothetical protein SAMN05443247_03119 [Bradyrhizobium erythrophlei]